MESPYLPLSSSGNKWWTMARRRRGFFDDIFRKFDELFERIEEEITEGLAGYEDFKRGFSSMYSVTVIYDEYGRPIVKVTAQGDVDRREIEEYVRSRYPNAKIVWEGEERPLHIKPIEESHVREVQIEETEKPRQRPRGTEIIEVDSKKPKVYEIKIEDDEKGKKWREIKIE